MEREVMMMTVHMPSWYLYPVENKAKMEAMFSWYRSGSKAQEISNGLTYLHHNQWLLQLVCRLYDSFDQDMNGSPSY
jgi:hypothetical protein